MSRSLILVAPLAMFALATSVLAGGPDCDKNAKNAAYAASAKGGCPASKEECAKHMAEAKNHGWLGIQYDRTEDGTSVVESVVKGSPAANAGFQTGDVLVALNGIEMNEANAARVKAAWKPLTPGSTVNYTVKRDGIDKELTVTLGKMPEDVYDSMVAAHMKEHVDVASK
jgi:C-terminal processing protease CtpA/Prc